VLPTSVKVVEKNSVVDTVIFFQSSGHFKSQPCQLKVGVLGSEYVGVGLPDIRIPNCLVLLLFRVLGITDLQVLVFSGRSVSANHT
jgi:hypothetical protein